MHMDRSPTSLPGSASVGAGDSLELSLTGSRLSVSRRPSSASPAKHFSRSVSVTADNKSKRNTLGEAGLGSSRSIKNLRRSNSTTQVNQRVNSCFSEEQSEDFLALFDSSSDGRRKLASLSKTSPDLSWNILSSLSDLPIPLSWCSEEQSEDFLALFDSSSDGRRKLASLSKTSPDLSWNILDDQPRTFLIPGSARTADSPIGMKKREAGIALAANFTANNRSNKGAVGNSVTTILHNNCPDKPLTPKSSNQKPASLNNIMKATVNDEGSLENSSLTKSQKNFSSPNNNAARSSPALLRRQEVTEEEAERFIQQVNHAAVTIQRWYRRHAHRRHTSEAALQRLLSTKKQEREQRAEEGKTQEGQKRKEEDRKRIREEKAQQARRAAIRELQQKRAQRAAETQRMAEQEIEALKQSGKCGGAAAESSVEQSPIQDHTERAAGHPEAARGGSRETARAPELPQREVLLDRRGEAQHRLGAAIVKIKKGGLLYVEGDSNSLTADNLELLGKMNQPPALPDGGALLSEAKLKSIMSFLDEMEKSEQERPRSVTSGSHREVRQLQDSSVNVTADLDDISNLRSGSPTDSPGRGSQGSQEVLQRGMSVEEQLQRAPSSRAQSKTTLNELLDTLKLLEEDPERLPEPQSYRKEKYSWIDEEGDSNSLTADNLELLGKMNQPPALPDGGALLSEAKLKSIMSFLDEMEKSEQERPRSVTSGSHREALLSEEDLAQVDQASATAAEVTGSMMRMKLELEEKRRTISMLQTALAQQRELTVRHIKETEKELNRNFQLQKDQYEATIQRHLAFIDQLIDDKKALSDRCEGVVSELKQVDQKYTKKIAHMQEQHDLEIKKLKELMSATEKIRREKWIDEKTKKIKEITVKGLEPEIQKLISKHKQELKKLRAVHEAELMQADERAAQRYVRQSEEMREQLEREKEEQCQRERELARQRYEKQLQEEEQALQQQRRRLYSEVAEEKERESQLAARQRMELDELRKHLEDNSLVAGRALREEFERTREEQERRHQAEVKALKERLDIEKQAWEENYMKKEEAWLLSRERELKEELRRGRDKEIELVIQRLEEETSRARDECERASENRVKRVREKYETELREMERSERSLQERHSELKGRLSQAEGEAVRLQGLLRQKEQEVQDMTQDCPDNIPKKVLKATLFKDNFLETIPILQWKKHATEKEYSRLKQYNGAHGWILKESLDLLNTTANQEMLDDWGSKANRSACVRCAVVGNGGILKGSQKGKEIDRHDYVFRTNGAVIEGFEKDVGSRTSFYTFSANTLRNSMLAYLSVGFRGPPKSEVSAYGFMTPNYAKFSDHYYDYIYRKVAFYINHDLRMEMRLWQQLHEAGIIQLYMRE
ncbi:UNVERIFIED_CONTAM: hypothetical protein FKN15_019083 [Acipenser sinensis]